MAHKIRQALLGNLWLKFLSLVIGAAVWMMVSNANNPIRTQLFTNVPITIVNQDAIADIGKVVEPEGSGTVTLRVTEKKSVLQQLTRSGSRFYVEADLNNITQMNTVPLTVTCSNSAVTWDEIEISPSSLKVTLEDKVEQTYAASVSIEGSPASGFAVGSTSFREGRNVVIAGPRSLMNIISQVVAPVDVTGLESDTTVAGTLKVYDKNGDPFTETQLSSLEFKDEQGSILANHMVSVRVNLWRIRNSVPIIVQTTGSPAWGYEVTDIVTIPETISLAGTEEALQQLGSGFVVSDQVDVTGATSSVTQELDLTATLSEMEGLKLLSDTDPTVQVEVVIGVSGDITLSVPLSDITFLNKPSGMDLVFTPADEVQVKLHALSDDAGQPAASDLKLSVDLAECAQEGSHELPVTVTAPEGYEPASDLTITVVSAKQEEQTEGR